MDVAAHLETKRRLKEENGAAEDLQVERPRLAVVGQERLFDFGVNKLERDPADKVSSGHAAGSAGKGLSGTGDEAGEGGGEGESGKAER